MPDVASRGEATVHRIAHEPARVTGQLFAGQQLVQQQFDFVRAARVVQPRFDSAQLAHAKVVEIGGTIAQVINGHAE